MALTAVEEAQLRDLIAQQSALLSLAGVEATILSKLGATKVTLSDLPTASAINDADLLLLRQGVTDKSVTGLTFKGLIPTVDDATTTVKGIAEIATQAEVDAGTDDVRFITPLKLKNTPLLGLGYGQTLQNLTASRALSTTYTNTTGNPIFIAVSFGVQGVTSYNYIYVNSVEAGICSTHNNYTGNQTVYAIVPPGASYSASGSATLRKWSELR